MTKRSFHGNRRMNKKNGKRSYSSLRKASTNEYKNSDSKKEGYSKSFRIKKNEEKPQTYDDLPPRGPLQVKNTVVGILYEDGEGGKVVPDNAFRKNNLGSIYVDKENLNGAPFKMTVVCEILNPGVLSGYRGKIIEVIGDMGNSDVRIEGVLRTYGLSMSFPDSVMEEVVSLPNNPEDSTINYEIMNGREDLRDLLTITIDGEEAKDLDDAISVIPLPGGNYRLLVHIADVSSYVREETNLDKEAALRGTSVYLVDRVIPMLPPKLSNGLCSLNPSVDRLTLTASMLIDENGFTYAGKIVESVIRSDRRMSYNECYRILEEPRDDDNKEYGEIISLLHMMKDLSSRLKTMRTNKGALDFSFPETKVILDNEGKVTDIKEYPINYCHGIIEQFMICANEFVAEKFSRMNYPFVYRIHEEPDPIKIRSFSNIAKVYGASGKLMGKITPLDVTRYMTTIRRIEAKPMLDTLLLRSMAKAKYSSECKGHFGLASKYYCHFTSPIRRYPDLYIHRIIKSFIHEEGKRKHFMGLVSSVSSHSSDMEINSVEAERCSKDIKCCEYMCDKIGQSYEGVITGIIGAGLFVMLPSTVEGFVPFRTMSDHYYFDEGKYMAIGSRTGKKYSIGMSVYVTVESVNLDEIKIDFRLNE